MGINNERREVKMTVSGWDILKSVLVVLGGGSIAFTLWYLISVSEKEADEMGVITPKMTRDPEVIARLERDTPLGVKKELQEAVETARLSEMADKEVGEDGVVRKKN